MLLTISILLAVSIFLRIAADKDMSTLECAALVVSLWAQCVPLAICILCIIVILGIIIVYDK